MFESLRFTIIETGQREVSHRNWDLREFNPFSKLYHVSAGRGRFTYGGETVSLEPGNLYLVPSHRPLTLACDHCMTHSWVHFTAELAKGVTLFDLMGSNPVVRPEPADAVERFMARLVAIGPRPPDEADALEAQGTLRLLLAIFLRRGRRQPEQLQRQLAALKPFRDLLGYISDNLHRPLTVAELAAQVHWHPTYFANRFSKALGVSPKSYIVRKRLELAQQLLWHDERPLKAVAAEVGYADPYYFARLFKRATGIAPGRYRRQRGERGVTPG
ncbi:MAG: AraC family transcriptional regulator [Lentisphaeria bacterium]|jgi:AraC-like DNA-binding protein